MAQKKEGTEKKPGVKIQDLSPKKDAKGGAKQQVQGSGKFADGSVRSADAGIRSADAANQSQN